MIGKFRSRSGRAFLNQRWRLPAIGLAGAIMVGLGIWWSMRDKPEHPQGGPELRERSSAADKRRERKDQGKGDDEGRLGRAGNVGLSELVDMFAKSEVPRLSRRQIDAYLNKNGRKTQGLLAASNLVEGRDLLDEAAQKDPNNPQVLLALALDSGSASRRDEVLEALAVVAPTNALADYLIALRDFSGNKKEGALAALQRATEKPMMSSYNVVMRMSTAAIYHSAGYSPPAARVAASFRENHEWCSALASLGPHLGRSAAAAVAAGQSEDALDIAFMGMKLSERMRGGGTLLSQSMACGPERAVLSALPKDALLQTGGPTVGELLDQSGERAREIDELQGCMKRLREMSSEEQVAFFEIAVRSGEIQAARQLRDKLAAGEDPR